MMRPCRRRDRATVPAVPNDDRGIAGSGFTLQSGMFMVTMLPPLDYRTSALFLDVDGTLIDIAARPEDVSVPSGLISDLTRLARRLDGALAFVSGRTIAILDILFDPLRLPAAGAHGGEMRFEPGQGSILQVGGALSGRLRAALGNLAATHRGLIAEDKLVGFAVHYRANPPISEHLRTAIAAVVAAEADPTLAILDGHFVFEVKRATYDKGAAVDAFMQREPFVGRRPVFVGDDITDDAAFAVLPRFGGTGHSVARNAANAVRSFESAGEVRAWLTHFATCQEAATS
jgi:trehalose 6-phosphate phosphatase